MLGRKIEMKEIYDKGQLRLIEDTLAEEKNIKVIHTLDDFLLQKQDVDWFAKTFGNRIVFFRNGGHLGQFYTKAFQDYLIKFIGDGKPPKPQEKPEKDKEEKQAAKPAEEPPEKKKAAKSL